MVQPTTSEYIALIDWSNANWGDPAYDFGDSPIRTVPYVLDGYRQIMPLDNDETAEVAVLSVQWRAWVYSLLLLAGYRTFGLARAPAVPTRWGQHHFRPILTTTPDDWTEKT